VIPDDQAECLTQKAAARLLGVSTGWLRASSAPRLQLPGNGPAGQPLLRYSRTALLEWAGVTCSRTQQDARQSAWSAQPCASGQADKPGGNPREKSAAKSADQSRGTSHAGSTP
jgi:hypothetical protein